MKRVLIIIGILVGAVAIVTLGMLLRGNGTPTENPGAQAPNGTLPIAGTGESGTGPSGSNGSANGTPNSGGGNLPVSGVNVVAQAAAIDYAPTADGVIFLATNGAIISASSSEVLGEANFGKILGGWFSPDGKLLLVKSGDSSFVSWKIFDIAKKTWKDIQVNTSEMKWSPNGSQLAYFASRTGGSTLTTYTLSTSATKALLTLSAPDLSVEWKDASHLFIMDRPSSLVPGTIWDFSTTGSLTQFATNVSGAELLWGGPTSGGLLFKAGPTGGTLALVNSAGGITEGTSFLTLPSKCVFGESAVTSTLQSIDEYLFCGIPQDQNLMKENQLPDDYLKGKFGTADALYAINTVLGTLSPVLSASQNFSFDAANLKVYGDSLYLMNRNDRKIYRVLLPALAGSEVGD